MYFSAVSRHFARWSLLPAFALCMTMPASASAQDILTEVPPERMIEILTSMGLEVEDLEGVGDSDWHPLRFELGGYQTLMFLANENTDAQLYFGFRTDISTEKINEWNSRYRFARAYRDDDGDPVLESDIDFTGGVTEENIKAWVRLFRDLMGEYARFVQ